MSISRRGLLQRAGCVVGTGVMPAIWSRSASAQSDSAVTARLAEDMQTHASFGLKFAASPGDDANAEWTASRLRALGYRVDISHFDTPFFDNRRSELRFGGTAVTIVPQAPVLPTTAAGIDAPLALIEDDGFIPDLSGRIAVIVAPFARHAALFPTRGIGMTVLAAADAGAVAIVLITTGPSGEAIALNSPDNGSFVSVPMAILAPNRADAVVSAARAGVQATFVVDGTASRRPCKNVVAQLDRGPQWIAVSTPRSGWYHCVAERGTGQATFLEIAAWLEQNFPMHSVFLMNTGAHEYFFAGSHHALEAAPRPEQTLVWAHIGATLAARDATDNDGEWVMLDTVDPERSTMATDSARSAVIESFAGLEGLEEPGIVRPQAGELSTFTDMGFGAAFACIGLHRWFHTTGDTIECVDARLLLPVVRAHQATIARLVQA